MIDTDVLVIGGVPFERYPVKPVVRLKIPHPVQHSLGRGLRS
jgi:hypothetical protein